MTWAGKVWNFNNEIVRYPFPAKPCGLSPDRLAWAKTVLGEELQELGDAKTPEQQADALIDLVYFAIGRLCEMGLSPARIDAAFDRVHSANMNKVPGLKPGRSEGQGVGYDAIKPPGWQEPRLEDLFTVRLPKLIVVGHGRHGKDTACEYLRDRYGFKFSSSSEFCAEHVVMPWMHANTPLRYASWQDCFNDRHNNRAHWYDAISAFNTPDKSRLGRAILGLNDIYNGLRNSAELWAMKATGLVDAIVWIDRSGHQLLEPRTSMTIEPWMADFHVDNNGTPEDLYRNLDRLAVRLIKDKNP